MDPIVIAVSCLTGIVAMLTFVGWLGHLDVARILRRMDDTLGRMDRSAAAAERAADGAREAAVAARETAKAANLSANACMAMTKEVTEMVRHFMRDRPQPGPAE